MRIDENIYKLRKAKGITQEELAGQVGVSRQCVSLWETGQTLPSLENLAAMREIFGATMSELCGDERTGEPIIHSGATIANMSSPPAEKNGFFAYSKVVIDNNLFKTIAHIALRKVYIYLAVLTVWMVTGIIASIMSDNYGLLAVVVIVGLLLALPTVRIFVVTYKKRSDSLTYEGDPVQDVWFFDDHFDLLATTDKSVSNVTFSYTQTKILYKNENHVFLQTKNGTIVLDFLNGDGDLKRVHLLFRDGSNMNRRGGNDDNSDLPSKKAEAIKIIRKTLFGLSIASMFFALIVVAVVSSIAANPVVIVEYMWVFFVFVPIPLASIVIGIYSRRHRMKGKANAVVGIIMAILLSVYGSFSFIFSDIILHDYNYVKQIGQTIEFEMPTNGEVITESYNVSVSIGLDGTKQTIRQFDSVVTFYDAEEIAKFESTIQGSELWLTTANSFAKSLKTDSYYNTADYNYFLLYNTNLREYNANPSEGNYNMLFLAYKTSKSRLMIYEYVLVV